MDLNLNYYFNNYEQNNVINQLTKNITNIWEMRNNAKNFLEKEVTLKALKENHGTLLGENIT